MKKKKSLLAYKAFNIDWMCRGKQYEVGKEYKETNIEICRNGIHACLNLSDCFDYYSFDEKQTKIAEVEIKGKYETHESDSKICTDYIKIIREIYWDEILKICNTGDRNTGDCNTGDRNTGNSNTGDCNTGDCNTGDRNTGNRNTGNCNTGDRNTGDRNTGNSNTGDCNTGDRNTGNSNTGDCNTGNRNTGIFNTVEQKIYAFNFQTNMFYSDWQEHPAYNICLKMELTSFISYDIMSEQEKKENPVYQTIGGYLKKNTFHDACEIWWNKLSDEEKNIVKTIPNFDEKIFIEITGIKNL